jgi:glutamate-5-semialdehyde dehydrogenase
MSTIRPEIRRIISQAKIAARRLACASETVKNEALGFISQNIVHQQAEILEANRQDYLSAEASGMSVAMLDRLQLSAERLAAMARDVLAIAALPDPLSEFIETRTLPNGLLLAKKRVPLGVIATIYESRPNVTVDISTLCLKSGNAVVLRGGKESLKSNQALARLVRQALEKACLPPDAVQLIEDTDHALVAELLAMRGEIDLVIPRGGAGLINYVRDNALVPVVAGGIGVCHTYIDKSATVSMGVDIVYNAKVQRPTVCNALDTILVHAGIAGVFLPEAAASLGAAGVELRCDARALEILSPLAGFNAVPTQPDDFGREFLDLIASVRVVDSLDEALEHITSYGSGHSEAIVTDDYSAAMRFLNEVDAACVYVNASTRFTDGGQFGLGAELGISTQKMHARGPLGLREITSYKWIVFGTGQVRP